MSMNTLVQKDLKNKPGNDTNVVLEILDIFSGIFKDWEVFWKSSDFLGRSWKVRKICEGKIR